MPAPVSGYRIEKLNPLAVPKGQSLTCELTGKPALYSCVTPHITLHFASRESAKQTWEGILHKVSAMLAELQAPQSLVGSEEERARRLEAIQASKLDLIDICIEEAARHVVQGRCELAIPAATYALRFGTSMYGEGKLELVPAYLQLAEANLGLLQYRQAEEYLTLANWALLKAGGASNALRSQLRRNFGKLYASQGRHEEALRQLADDVYYSSLMVGPEHIDTSGGYFQLGNVFYAMNRIEAALAMYDKVVDIWYKCLASLMTNQDRPPLSDATSAAGVEMIAHILKRREECAGATYIATGEAHYILGLLQQHCGEPKLAQASIRTALGIYENQLGPDHHSTQDVARALASIEAA
jgi:tetratricopeptide (TPR) repeat protein